MSVLIPTTPFINITGTNSTTVTVGDWAHPAVWWTLSLFALAILFVEGLLFVVGFKHPKDIQFLLEPFLSRRVKNISGSNIETVVVVAVGDSISVTSSVGVDAAE